MWYGECRFDHGLLCNEAVLRRKNEVMEAWHDFVQDREK
jgi:hypothetical protein